MQHSHIYEGETAIRVLHFVIVFFFFYLIFTYIHDVHVYEKYVCSYLPSPPCSHHITYIYVHSRLYVYELDIFIKLYVWKTCCIMIFIGSFNLLTWYILEDGYMLDVFTFALTSYLLSAHLMLCTHIIGLNLISHFIKLKLRCNYFYEKLNKLFILCL